MSKFKLSFSLILAILLVGILSTSAFARDPYGLKPVQGSGLTLNVPFTGNSADPADVEGKRFTLQLFSPDGTLVKTYMAALDANKKATIVIPAADITPSVVYTVKLTHTGFSLTVLSSSTAVVTDSSNTLSLPALDTHGTLNKDGSKMINANQTGLNNTRKQRSGQKVHGFYENNTNSCASCHQTHTGADNNLLMKSGAYSTCASCHDGTMGAKNVWEQVSEETVQGIAGTFNYTLDHNSSIHEADGTLQTSAAPGANKTVGNTTWSQEFDCASCHAAHGAGSNTENNLNFDPMGWGSVAYSATGTDDQKYGKLFKDLPILDAVPATGTSTTPYILVRKTVTDADVANDPKKVSYLLYRSGVKAGDKIIQTYRLNGSKGYVADFSLWLQDTSGHGQANTVLKDSTGADITRAAGMTVIWKDGFAFGTKVADVTTAQISIGIDVETTPDIRSLFDTTYSGYIVDSGTEMSKYCASCHTDYLSATRKDSTGVYESAHRHQTATDSLTCVRCHFGHGSDAQIMKDANDQSYYDLTAAGITGADAITYLKDSNPSSALKRYTGMSVCYACHGQGGVFKNNANNNPNTANVPNGKILLPGQPGTR